MSDPVVPNAEMRRRRRWLTLGEFVAVAGLIVAVVSLYFGWSERRSDDAQRQADRAQARAEATEHRTHIGLVATESGGGTLVFKGSACVVQSADIGFPSALDVAKQNAVTDGRIDAGWFESPLLKADAGGKAKAGRLPVLIESRCTSDSGDRLERAIYDIPYEIDNRFLRGRSVRLRGLVLREYVTAAAAQSRLDSAWRALRPKPAP